MILAGLARSTFINYIYIVTHVGLQQHGISIGSLLCARQGPPQITNTNTEKVKPMGDTEEVKTVLHLFMAKYGRTHS